VEEGEKLRNIGVNLWYEKFKRVKPLGGVATYDKEGRSLLLKNELKKKPTKRERTRVKSSRNWSNNRKIFVHFRTLRRKKD